MKLEKGMIFRVFEVTHDCFAIGLKGSFFSEMNDKYLGNDFGVTAPYDLNVPDKKILAHFNIDDNVVKGHVKPIGRLIIKEVKNA